MNACPFEELSAWLDGEATPDESARVESHLKVCTRCRQTKDLMAQAGSTLARLEVALPPVEALRPKSLPKPWSLPQLSWPNHPIAMLRRRPGALPNPLAVLALFGLPALLFSLLNPEQAQVFLGLTAVGLLVGLPLHHFRTEVSVLTSLRRGRCLEEILSTGLPARQLVDTLAVQSLSAVARVGVPLVPVLALGSQEFHDKEFAFAAALAWLPLVVLLFWLGSYVVLFLGAWSKDGVSRNLPQQLLAALVLLPAAALAVWAHPLLGALWMAGTARYLAIWGLDHLGEVDRLISRPTRRRRNPWALAHSENPIVAREAMRKAASVPGGLAGVVGARALTMLLPLIWVLSFLDGGPEHWLGNYWVGFGILVLLVWARAASRTLGAVVGERERGTWETMMQTGLSQREFIQGWKAVTWGAVGMDFLPAVGVLIMAGFLFLPYPLAAPLLAGLLALFLSCGAEVGLALSALSRTTREANGRLIAAAGYGFLGWLALSGVGAAVAEWLRSERLLTGFLWTTLDHVVLFATMALTALAGRRWARRVLARELGFSSPVVLASDESMRRLVLLSSACAGVAVSLFIEPGRGSQWGDILVLLLAGGSLSAALGFVLHWLAEPLLSALTARLTHRAALVLGGAGVGALCGVVVSYLPVAAQLLAWGGLLPASLAYNPLKWNAFLPGWAAGAGTLAGALLSCALTVRPSEGVEWRPALRRATTRFVWTVVAVVGAGFALSASFLTYQVENPALVAQIRQEVAARKTPGTGTGRLAEALGKPTDPYLQQLAAYWSPATPPSELVARFRTTWEGEIRRAVEDPTFLPPQSKTGQGPYYNDQGPTFDLRFFRSVTLALSAAARTLPADEAVDLHLLGLRWGALLVGRGNLMDEMVAVSALHEHTKELLRLLEGPLSRASRQRILEVTASLPYSGRSFGQAMDRTLVDDVTLLEGARTSRTIPDVNFPLSWLPGFYFDYQAKLYTNLYCEQRNACYTLTDPSKDLQDAVGRARAGYLVQMLFPSVQRSIMSYRQGLSRLEAVRKKAALDGGSPARDKRV